MAAAKCAKERLARQGNKICEYHLYFVCWFERKQPALSSGDDLNLSLGEYPPRHGAPWRPHCEAKERRVSDCGRP